MAALALLYALFAAAHLVTAIQNRECDNRLVYIVSCGLGVVFGVGLIYIIIRSKFNKKHHRKDRKE